MLPLRARPLPSKIPADRIHLAPDSLKYRVFVEKRKEQVQLEREVLGTIRRKPELYCVPLKKALVPGGGPEDEGAEPILRSMPGKEMQWAIDGKLIPWYETDVHWYVVGGQHTYQACVTIAAKEELGSAKHKFYIEFDVVLVYSRDPDMLFKVSNALDIQVRDKVVSENFWSQLKNARAKWIEKGRPRSKLAGAKHDPKFKVRATKPMHTPPFWFSFQASVPIVSAARRYSLTLLHHSCVPESDKGVHKPLLRQERFKYHPEVPTVLPGQSYVPQVDGGVCGVGAGQAHRGGRQEA